LHHIELYVSDLGKSTAFWAWLLGLLGYEQFQKWADGISWKLGDFYIVLVQVERRFKMPEYHRKRVGLNHIALHAKSKEQVDEVAAALPSFGLRILYADRHPHAGGPDHYALYFEDPDRIKIELVAPGTEGE
jgi:catechol 2,3-dioxygenase-like lactoylglutathione lyase family enzyme